MPTPRLKPLSVAGYAVRVRPPGAYKIRSRHAHERASESPSQPFGCLDDFPGSDCRTQRVIESLRREIASGGAQGCLRIRMVFENPRELYRVEIERPELGYHRTTLLERDALEELLAADEVRAAIRSDSARVAER